MLNDAVANALNDQIQLELSSAYHYLAMSAYFETLSLPGCAHWMQTQAKEEMAHTMRIYEYVHDRGGRVVLQAIEQPPADYGTPREVFEAALAHERTVTKSIHDLYALAAREGDLATQSHLQWFVDEQVEEEKTAGDLVGLFARAGDQDAALLFIDGKLAQRAEAGH